MPLLLAPPTSNPPFVRLHVLICISSTTSTSSTTTPALHLPWVGSELSRLLKYWIHLLGLLPTPALLTTSLTHFSFLLSLPPPHLILHPLALQLLMKLVLSSPILKPSISSPPSSVILPFHRSFLPLLLPLQLFLSMTTSANDLSSGLGGGTRWMKIASPPNHSISLFDAANPSSGCNALPLGIHNHRRLISFLIECLNRSSMEKP
jgi:hypothetical protein